MRPAEQKSSKHELRTTVLGSQLEVRESQDQKKLVGRAVVFNSPTDIGGSFTETIAPGSFTTTLQEDDQIMLRDHRSELLLGRKSAGTLSLVQDQEGVSFEVTLPDTELGRDTYENVRLGNLKGCSFGFLVRDQEWIQDASGNLTRVITDVQCFEVTLTSMPAYDQTTVDIRSVRAKLAKRNSDVDDEEDDDLDCDGADANDERCEDRCSCECDECEDGDCSSCSDLDCDSIDCDSCPAQTRAAHMSLLLRRLR